MPSSKCWVLAGLLLMSLGFEHSVALPTSPMPVPPPGLCPPPHRPHNNVTWTNWNATNGTDTNGNGTDSDDDFIGKDQGIPRLNQTDIDFIRSEAALILAGFPDEDSGEQGSGENPFSGPNTKLKWDRLKMDGWLELYIRNISVSPGASTKLINSTDFMRDFWLSTGEEAEFTCRSLSSSCSVADISPDKRYSYISKEDALRAQLVRQCFKVYQSANKQSYDIIRDAVANAQTPIADIHKNFLQSDPPASTNILDVFLPALAAVAAFVPTLSPASTLLSGIYAAATVKRRGLDDDIPVADTPHLNKRADNGNVVLEIMDRLGEVEKEPTKSWLERHSKPIENSGKAIEKAAKSYAALLTLNPGLSKASISSWDNFDSRVQDGFLKYPTSLLQAFEQNIMTWNATEKSVTVGSNTVKVAVAGMMQVLIGGQWSKTEATKEPVSEIYPRVRNLLNTFVFMQVVQNQGIYYWTQMFKDNKACTAAAQDAISDGWLAKDGWYQCVQSGSETELRYARRPTTNRGDAKTSTDRLWNPFGDIVQLAMKPGSGSETYVQERSGNWAKQGGFDQSSVGLTKWRDSDLTAAGFSFKLDDVFKESRECQFAYGDPFNDDQAVESKFYHGMKLDENNAEQLLKGTRPACLFNLPIFSVGDDRYNRWCSQHIGKMSYGSLHRRTFWVTSLKDCGDTPEWWSLQSDTKICSTNNRNYEDANRTPRPGCEKHDRGIQLVEYRKPSN